MQMLYDHEAGRCLKRADVTHLFNIEFNKGWRLLLLKHLTGKYAFMELFEGLIVCTKHEVGALNCKIHPLEPPQPLSSSLNAPASFKLWNDLSFLWTTRFIVIFCERMK